MEFTDRRDAPDNLSPQNEEAQTAKEPDQEEMTAAMPQTTETRLLEESEKAPVPMAAATPGLPAETTMAEAVTEAPAEAPTEASAEEPAEAPVEDLVEASVEEVAEAPAEALSPSAPESPLEAISEMSDEEKMSELYEESLRRVQEGEVVKGRIVSITKDFVMVDIGYKSEGQIPIAEFTAPDGEITAQVGDQVEALLEAREEEEGPLMLSKNKASRIKVWEEISYAYHNESTVEGTIVAKVKGGLSVDLGGILAFLPGSQVDLVPVRHTDHLIGQTTTFNVLKFNRKRRNVVLSRRSLLEKAKEDAKATLLATLEEGKVVDGVIKNIPTTASSSTSGAWTGCCTSPTCPMAASAIPPTSSRWGTPSP